MSDTVMPIMRNVAVDPQRFRKLKTDLRDALLRIHRELSDGIWTETDDAVLDAITAWAVDVAQRTNTPGIPESTRKLVEAHNGR